MARLLIASVLLFSCCKVDSSMQCVSDWVSVNGDAVVTPTFRVQCCMREYPENPEFTACQEAVDAHNVVVLKGYNVPAEAAP